MENEMNVNFKKETMEIIKEIGAEVLAYKFMRVMDPFFEKGNPKTFKGKGEINWEKIPAKLLQYDDGFGCQYWRGIILLSNNTWLERAEYDGSEWWEHNEAPTVKDVLSMKL